MHTFFVVAADYIAQFFHNSKSPCVFSRGKLIHILNWAWHGYLVPRAEKLNLDYRLEG